MTYPARELDPIAVEQLRAWRSYASRWYYYLELRITDRGHRLGGDLRQYHLICAVCTTSIAVMMSQDAAYLMSTELTLDAVTRHIRNQHREIEGEVYGGEQGPAPDTALGGTGARNGAGPHPD